MFRTLLIYFLLTHYFRLIKCEIPELTVRKVDSHAIELKRQDTLEMCRQFTEENDLQKIQSDVVKPKPNGNSRRVKREIEPLSKAPFVAKDTKSKVESIVAKIYDDLQEKGQKITYRQRNLENLTTTKALPVSNSSRRFDFAPAKLYKGLMTDVDNKDEEKSVEHSYNTIAGVEWRKKWKHGIIPYFIDSKTYDFYLVDMIIDTFDYIEKATCIRFQRLRVEPVDKESLENVEWLYISNPSGIRQCVHSNERKPNLGVQMVVFGYDCMARGDMVHEVMHILGFSHEHTRPDRDQHITINWDNIKSGYKKYFTIQEDYALTNLPYDFASVLHYPARAFSKNGQRTISVESSMNIGQREGLSEIDVEKIGIVFGMECIKRNKDYLLKTCPIVVKAPAETKPATPQEIEDYFKDRIWPYGIVNFQLKDDVEFSTEEKMNIRLVLHHIQKETCIQFKDNSDTEPGNINENNNRVQYNSLNAPRAPGSILRSSAKGNKLDGNNKADREKVSSSKRNRRPNLLYEGGPLKAMESYGVITGQIIWNELNNKSGGNENKGQKDSPSKGHEGNLRHAGNVLVLTRSNEPGCQCPETGRPNGDKIVKINDGCFNSLNDLLHFFVHVLGLDHEHNMYDRDSYIRIIWDKLTPELKSDMDQKLPAAAAVGFEYDYQSVMHFPWLEIKNGVTNIMYPIWNDGWAMGNWQGLSVTDVMKLNRIYEQECAARNKQL